MKSYSLRKLLRSLAHKSILKAASKANYSKISDKFSRKIPKS